MRFVVKGFGPVLMNVCRYFIIKCVFSALKGSFMLYPCVTSEGDGVDLK